MQIILVQEPNFIKNMRAELFEIVNADDHILSREEIVNLWANNIETINGIDTKTYLNAMPLFNGRKLDQGFYPIVNISGSYIVDIFSSYSVDGLFWWSSVISVKNQSVWNTSAPTSWSGSRQQTSADSNCKFSRSCGQSAWETANRFKKNVCRNWPTRNDRNTQHGPRTFNTSSGGNFCQYRSDFRSAPLLSCHNKKELSIVNIIKPHEKAGFTHHT